MSIKKYLNKNKIGAVILIIVIIIAFGFGGFGGGFLSNNQNNIAKINKTNITTKDLINFINQSGVSKKVIQDNLDNNIIEELLSSLVSTTLLSLEVEDYNLKYSQDSLSKRIKLNKDFIDENGNFQRIKYEKFLLENNISAPIFENRLKDRELQKKLFDFIGAGTVSPEFLVKKLFEHENRQINIDYINLEIFYKKREDISDQELTKFINQNIDDLKERYINFEYSIINPLKLIGVNEFNQDFFDKIDKIENNILNGTSFNTIASENDLEVKKVNNYVYSDKDNLIKKKIYEIKNNKFDIIEIGDDYVVYKITKDEKRTPDISDLQTKKEILDLVIQKYKFNYNRELFESIRNDKFSNKDFLELGGDKIQSLTLNSMNDDKKFNNNSLQIIYSLPINSFTLINDDEENVYLTKIKKFNDLKVNQTSEVYKSFITRENTELRNSILEAYDFYLNEKYDVKINQMAIKSVKNIFQ